MIKSLTTQEFIERARKVHGDKYDYSKVEYVNNRVKICIICPIHGEFWQTPNAHLNGQGCSMCGRISQTKKRALSKETFITKARKVHGDKYDYSKVEYVNGKTKVCIICPIHGEFWQMPVCHLKGEGCVKCGYEKTKKSQSFTREMFIEKAKNKYGDKYDYSKVEYINSQTPILITCKIHGDFSMRPNDHLQGQECPKCKLSKLRKKFAFSREEFIERARKVHGDKYDYSKVEYVNNRTKVCIICKKHGEFWQTPDHHLLGGNCPQCNKSKLEEQTNILLNENNIKFEEQKHFDWLGKQTLDFYLPEYNVAIECQGVQHFKPVARFGGKNGFDDCFKNDIRKYELCKNSGVKLLYYTELPQYFTFLGEKLIKNKEALINAIKEK